MHNLFSTPLYFLQGIQQHFITQNNVSEALTDVLFLKVKIICIFSNEKVSALNSYTQELYKSQNSQEDSWDYL